MKNEENKGMNIVKAVAKVGTIYIADSLIARLTPGTQGQINRTDLKIFRTAVIYKLTPFGNKKKQEKKLEYLERKMDRLHKKLDQEQKAKRR